MATAYAMMRRHRRPTGEAAERATTIGDLDLIARGLVPVGTFDRLDRWYGRADNPYGRR